MVEKTQSLAVEIFEGLIDSSLDEVSKKKEQKLTGYDVLREIYGKTINEFHIVRSGQVEQKSRPDGLLTASKYDDFRNEVLASDITKEDLVAMIIANAYAASLGRAVNANGGVSKVVYQNTEDTVYRGGIGGATCR